MKKIYVYTQNTMADWETGYITAELYSKRFFKKDAPDTEIMTVGLTNETVRTMGGFNIIPDCSVEEIQISGNNMIILPGADTWTDEKNSAILNKATEMMSSGGSVAAICGATAALAWTGILDSKRHTSNGSGFLEMVCPVYKGSKNYVDEPAVRDGNLITAAATGPIEFAREILSYLDVFSGPTLDAWYNYFKTGKAEWFYAMMKASGNM